MQLDTFARPITPIETVLLLGAGVSVPAGGMTGQGLADYLCAKVSGGAIEEHDLSEACTLLSHMYSRQAVVGALRDCLNPLQPDGGLLGLLALPWARIYTTNFDELAERAAEYHDLPYSVIRSNFDFTKLDSGDLEILKIHGCVTEDRAFGSRASMVLTTEDYISYSKYREQLFGKLEFDLHTKDVLIIGQSLRDPHLKRLVDQVVDRARSQGLGNRVRLLTYDHDQLRESVLEQRGIQVASGPLDQLLEKIAASRPSPATTTPSDPARILTPRLLHQTIIVSHEVTKPHDATKLFNGEPATYADIGGGLTFERDVEERYLNPLLTHEKQFLVILGASGVGKSTMARRIAMQLQESGLLVYEHKAEFPLQADWWIEVAKRAADARQDVVLLVDDAASELGGINRIVRALEDEKNEWFKIVLTSHTARWSHRSKSAGLVSRGEECHLSILTPSDVDSLVALCQIKPDINALVKPAFRTMPREHLVRQILSRCKSDMFVALKYCFPGESLDKIILREYSELGELAAEVYKYVALIESAYGRPSRQLILETLGLGWDRISEILRATAGIVVQKLTDPSNGVYSWTTRHPTIAEVITQYKWFDQDDVFEALENVIEHMNSAQLLDRQLIPHLCDGKLAIGRLKDPQKRIALYTKLTQLSNNRVPRHRIIATYLNIHDLDSAERAIAEAEMEVGLDSPIHNYKVQLGVARGLELWNQLKTDDYLALLYQAWNLAEAGIEKWPENKHSYLALADVAEAIYSTSHNADWIRQAMDTLQGAYDEILDVELLRRKASLSDSLD